MQKIILILTNTLYSGCVDPYGAYMQGNYGSVARDTDSTGRRLSDDGLVMEAFDGPPRKD